MNFRRLLPIVAMTFAAPIAIAQDKPWPQAQPIRIIVPFAGGSGSDATARYYAQKLQPLLGQTLYVENRPGADGALGMQAAKMAPADGYTFVQGGISPSVMNAILMKDPKYDAVKDFKPVMGYGRNMNVVLVPADSKFRTLEDMKAASKKTPLSVGVFSTTLKLSAQWLSALTGVQINMIPYKGQAQILTDVIGKQLDFALVDLGGATPMLEQKKVRGIVVTGETRSPVFTDIPTLKELGHPELVQYSWNAFFIRSEVPDEIAAKLGAAVRQVMVEEETKQVYRARGSEQVPLSPAEMRKLQLAEIERYRKVAADAGIEAQ